MGFENRIEMVNRETMVFVIADITQQLTHKLSGVASYGALGHVPPSTSNSFLLVHFGVNLTANYPSIV